MLVSSASLRYTNPIRIAYAWGLRNLYYFRGLGVGRARPPRRWLSWLERNPVVPPPPEASPTPGTRKPSAAVASRFGGSLARIFHTRTKPFINTGALARWEDAHSIGELFQQFVTSCGKPLKRLCPRDAWLHRAKAPVLMRTCRNVCEISRLGESGFRVQLRSFKSDRNVARFWTSSCRSSDLGVSRQPGWFLNRASLTMCRNPSFPIWP